MRAAADRAIALGAPGQAATFLERALEVTEGEADRADLHERAGRAAIDAAKREQALGHFQAAGELLQALGDRPGEARLAARRAQALASLRRREEATALLEDAWARFSDLGDDDPNLVLLAGRFAAVALVSGDYERAYAMADRSLEAAERLGLAEDAVEALNTLGTAAFYRGRQWQARALLEGARQVALESNLYTSLFRTL